MSQHPILDESTLELLGLKAKDYQVYTTLLALGTAPLRRVAQESGLNRGTVYDALKRLIDLKLVSYLDAKTHRYFTCEDPVQLRALASQRELAVQEAREKVSHLIPDLKALLGNAKYRPTVRYYEGKVGVRAILEDILQTTAKTRAKEYRVYSSEGIRDLIAAAWPSWNKKRTAVGIKVKAIAIGSGGTTHGLDARRWLTRTDGAPTYIFIYEGKTAYVAVDENQNLFGVLIEDTAVASTQTMIFDALWSHLE